MADRREWTFERLVRTGRSAMQGKRSIMDLLHKVWYHSSTCPDWPSASWDPTSNWNSAAFRRMERLLGVGSVEQWRDKQMRKCLHLGTYEAAIENMKRRVRNQNDDGQFYLYRVILSQNSVLRPELIEDPGGFAGDVWPETIMSVDESVVGYFNAHEDVGSISRAVRKSSILAVQRTEIGPFETEEEVFGRLLTSSWRACT